MSPSFIDSLARVGVASLAEDAVAMATALLAVAWLSRSSCTDHRPPCGIDSGAWHSAASSSCRSSAGPFLDGDCRSCRRPSRVRAERARGREGGLSREHPLGQHAAKRHPQAWARPRHWRVANPQPQSEPSQARPAFIPIAAVWGLGFLATALPALLGIARNEWRRGASRRVADRDWRDLLDGLSRQLALGRSVELRIGPARRSRSPGASCGRSCCCQSHREGGRHRPAGSCCSTNSRHIKRFDVLFQLAGRLTASVYWFHPLAWFAAPSPPSRMRIRLRRLRDCGRRTATPTTPESWWRWPGPSSRSGYAAAVPMSREGTLEGRVRALFDDRRSHGALRRGPALGLLAGGLALMTGLAVVRPAVSIAGPRQGATADRSSRRSGPSARCQDQARSCPRFSRTRSPSRAGQSTSPANRSRGRRSSWRPVSRVTVGSARRPQRRMAGTSSAACRLPIKRAETVMSRDQGVFEVFGQAVGYGFAWRPRKQFLPQPTG